MRFCLTRGHAGGEARHWNTILSQCRIRTTSNNSEPRPHFMERAEHGVIESAGQVTPTMIDEEGPIME